MKKILYSIFLMGSLNSYAQQSEINFLNQNINFSAPPRTTINPMSIKLLNNYVNVGGPTTYGTVLEIYGQAGHQTGQLYFGGWDNSKIRYREAFYGQNTWSDWLTLLDSKNNVETDGSLMIQGNGSNFIKNGNLGLGKINPEARLDVDGSIIVKSATVNTSSRPPLTTARINGEIRAYSQNGLGFDDGFLRLSAGAGTNTNVMSFIDISGYSALDEMDRNILMGTAGQERFRISASGNVGIGTSSPNEKLAVNGKIRAKEVKVEVANWPDYVFEEGYKIPSLGDLERYIKAHGHLPDMPKAKDAEDNGISLGEMNKLLLKKIEELTLILIEKDKEKLRDSERLKALEDKLEALALQLKKQ